MLIRPLNATMAFIFVSAITPVGDLFAQQQRRWESSQQEHTEAVILFAQPLIQEESFGLLRGNDSNAFAVFSKQRKRWSNYRFADHLKVQPLTLGEVGPNASEAIIGFEYGNGPVSELVAVDTRGRFRKHVLDEPIDRELKPFLLGDSILYYIADETIYAFSGVTGSWDPLQVPGLPDVEWKNGKGIQPSKDSGFDTVHSGRILVDTPRGRMKFSADVGVWQLTEDVTTTSREL